MENAARNEPAMARWLPHLAIAAGVLMVVQAFLAGRGLFFDRDLIEIHGYVGEFTFLIGVAIVISAWLGRQSGRYGQTELILAGTNMILIVAQVALGYSTRDNLAVVAWHLANAILVSGTIAALIALSLRRPLPSEPVP
jgi:hypothetical protein